jgi:hypothetical protein
VIQRENCSNRSKAQSSAWPEPRKKLPPRPSMLDRFKLGIDVILRADLDASRKHERALRDHGRGRRLPRSRAGSRPDDGGGHDGWQRSRQHDPDAAERQPSTWVRSQG